MRIFKTYHPAELKSVAKKITVVADDNPSGTVTSMPCFADGLPGIYFQESDREVALYKDEKKLSNLFLYGQTVQPVNMDMVSPFKVIIVHLFPPALKSLFGIDAHELTDKCVDYSLLPGKDTPDLKDKLLEEENSIHTQMNMLVDALRKLLYTIQPSTNGELYYATNRITLNGGEVSLRSLQKELKISERTFQRKFLKHVGVTPSQFKQICRFRAALDRLESNSFQKLSDIAYDHGFSDQSHFNRIFKEYTGFTPGEYLEFYRNRTGKAKHSNANKMID